MDRVGCPNAGYSKLCINKHIGQLCNTAELLRLSDVAANGINLVKNIHTPYRNAKLL